MESFSSWILLVVFFWWIRDRMEKLEKRMDKLESKSASEGNRPSVW